MHMIITLILFMIVYTPSIKFFIFSPLVNVFTTIALMCCFFIDIFRSHELRFGVFNKFLPVFISLTIILLVTLFNSVNINADELIRFLSLYLLIGLSTLLFHRVDFKIFSNLSIAWGCVLVFCYYFNVIEVSGSGELSYLIFTAQLMISFSFSLAYSKYSNNRFPYFFISVVFLYVILIAGSRSAFILSVLFFVFFLLSDIYSSFRSKNYIKLMFYILVCLYFLPKFINVIYASFDDTYFQAKTMDLFSGDIGIRGDIYSKAIFYILDNPFGGGLNIYNQVLGIYPRARS